MVNNTHAIAAIAQAGVALPYGGMTQFNDTSSLLAFLKTRKSASAKAMSGPGPSDAELRQLLALATRVPDHGKLTPWRFITFTGEARAKIGERFAARWKVLHPEHGDEILAFMRGFMMRAPTVVAVVSKAAAHPKIPVWEQQMSAGAVCMNILLAATALGIGCQWNTDWVAYDAGIASVMGLQPHEKVAGIMYFGTSTVELEDRPRPDAMSLVTRWQAS